MDQCDAITQRSAAQIARHAVVAQVLPSGVLLFLFIAGTGFLPSWTVCGLLFVGASVAWVFHAIKRDRVALSICGITALACLILLWPRVQIRAATPADKTYDRYFGAPHEKFVARNIAIAEGTFTLDTWLTGYLYHVQNGAIRELNALAVGRTPNAIGAPHWVDMRITLALVTYESGRSTITQLASHGQSRGGGSGSEAPTLVAATHQQFVSGRLFSGQSRILYVEGDSQFTLTPAMTVETFAQANNGSFYVIVAGLQ